VTTTLAWRIEQWLRLRIGSAILGGGWLGVLMRYKLIAERAQDCITPDGRVILANCAPLAEALYAQIPGEWTLSVVRTRTTDPLAGAPVPAVDPSRSTPDEKTGTASGAASPGADQ
jgi:hypothetical protein